MPSTRRRALELTAAATAAATLRPVAARAAGDARGASFAADLGHALPRGATVAGAQHVLPAMKAPRRFDLIGLDFGPAAHVHAEVRARRRGGAWSPWTAVHGATQPCWTGAADDFQVRFTGAARRLRARFVRVGRPPAGAHASRRATAGGAAPPILDRRSWGGNRLPPKEAPIYGVVHAGFVHHTVTANNYAPSDSRSIVLAICHYHRDHNGWNDIGYNFLVDKYGQIFEGRDGGIDQAVIGAQAQGYNSSSTGVSCLGDYTSLGFTKPGLEAVAQLLAYKLPLHGVPVKGKVTVTSQGGADNRYRSGARVRLDRISGHRDGDATTCPGNGLYRQLAGLRDRTDQLAVPLSGLTIRAAQTELRYPAPLDLAGGLRFEDESSAAGAPIQVQYQPRGGSAWQVLQTLPARGDGTFATEVPLPTSGRVRAVFPGDLTRAAVDGSPIDVTVVPGLALTLSPRRPPVGSATTVAGTVTPAGPKRARLTVERRVGSRYLPVSRRKVQVSSDGAVDTTFRPSRPGLYRVSLSVGGATARRFVRAV